MTKPATRKLRQAVQPSDAAAPDVAARIRLRFFKLGDIRLALAEREPVRDLAEQPSIRPARPPKRSH